MRNLRERLDVRAGAEESEDRSEAMKKRRKNPHTVGALQQFVDDSAKGMKPAG